ncbi:polyketide synthase dehydratase domain-containing protein, partial [Streptomyces viridochromogenes]|uniref:polyketide synthase dehydratase domain-containing protein n=1 Tax=Streptomyces viridochromogenes TaxID=1938 RepID=UPI0006C14242
PHLPTYAFQHHRYWLNSGLGTGDPADLGLGSVEHPMLGALAEDPATGGLLFTSRWSLWSQPWLADHAAGGTTLVPGAALVDLLIRAGDQANTSHLTELVIEAPLLVPEEGGLHVRVSVSGPDESGVRTAHVHSRVEDAEPGAAFTRHASARLAPEAPAPDFDLAQWPPAGAARIDGAAERAYGELDATGYGYGPAFRGLRAVWTQGSDVYAEVTLPEEAGKPEGYGLHPALLDACLHAGVFGERENGASGQRLMLPFVWNGVSLHATGATTLRVQLSPQGSDSMRVRIADATGAAVASVDSLVTRPFNTAEVPRTTRDSGRDHLYRVFWETAAVTWQEAGPDPVVVVSGADVRAVAEAGEVPDVLVLGVSADGAFDAPDASRASDVSDAAAVHTLTSRVLEVVQAYLAEPRLQDTSLLAVTHGAFAVEGPHSLTDLPAAAAAGLLRSAQAENPGRITLLDTDDTIPLNRIAATLNPLDEPQLAIRQGTSHVPR